MTQTNTTQNKEELEWRQRLQGWLEQVNLLESKPNVQGGQLVFKGTRVTLTSLINFIIDVRDKSLSQAHQSGIEEERKRIITELKKLEEEKMSDAEHCSCLRYAIWRLENPDSETMVYASNKKIESLKENKQ